MNNEKIKSTIAYDVEERELIIKKNGREIYGVLYAPKEEGKYPAIIMCHGYNGCNSDFMNECRYFAKNGYAAYAFDFCGGSTRSKSSGKSTDMTIFTEKEDLLAVFGHIRRMEIVDDSKVFLFGGSQGGFAASLATEERREEVKALALYYPAFCIPDNWTPNFKTEDDIPETVSFWDLTLGKSFFASIRNFSVFDNIGKFAGDVLIIHGDKDEIVPVDYSVRAQKTYKNARLEILPGEAHGFTPEGGQKAMQMILEFMQNN